MGLLLRPQAPIVFLRVLIIRIIPCATCQGESQGIQIRKGRQGLGGGGLGDTPRRKTTLKTRFICTDIVLVTFRTVARRRRHGTVGRTGLNEASVRTRLRLAGFVAGLGITGVIAWDRAGRARRAL